MTAQPPTPTVVLHDGRLPDGRRVDLHIADGIITGIVDHDGATDRRQGPAVHHSLGGRLVLPALAEPHAHVDKALTADLVDNPTGDLVGAIDGWIAASAAGKLTYDDMVVRSRRALELLLLNGTTAVRTHVNVGETIGASHAVAVREAAEPFAGLIDLELVALPISPLTGPEGAANRRALVAAIEAGVDLIGGCPHLDPDPHGLIRQTIEMATDAGLGIDLHTDETLDPDMLTLPELARQVLDSGFSGPVAASHCVSLGMQPAPVQREVSRLVAEAGVAVVTLPHTNLFLQGREHPVATPRGLTAVRALEEAGVLVVAGADNVQDPFNLVGRSDPLETAALMMMVGHVSATAAIDMVGDRVRSALRLPPAGPRLGDRADLLAIGAPNVRGAIADAPHDRLVFRGGRLIARSVEERSLVTHD